MSSACLRACCASVTCCREVTRAMARTASTRSYAATGVQALHLPSILLGRRDGVPSLSRGACRDRTQPAGRRAGGTSPWPSEDSPGLAQFGRALVQLRSFAAQFRSPRERCRSRQLSLPTTSITSPTSHSCRTVHSPTIATSLPFSASQLALLQAPVQKAKLICTI